MHGRFYLSDRIRNGVVDNNKKEKRCHAKESELGVNALILERPKAKKNKKEKTIDDNHHFPCLVVWPETIETKELNIQECHQDQPEKHGAYNNSHLKKLVSHFFFKDGQQAEGHKDRLFNDTATTEIYTPMGDPT